MKTQKERSGIIENRNAGELNLKKLSTSAMSCIKGGDLEEDDDYWERGDNTRTKTAGVKKTVLPFNSNIRS